MDVQEGLSDITISDELKGQTILNRDLLCKLSLTSQKILTAANVSCIRSDIVPSL